MSIDLLVSKSEYIIKSLPTDKKLSSEMSKSYKQYRKKLTKYGYVHPGYHKRKPEPTYLC